MPARSALADYEVMVVDDSPHMRQLLRSMLQSLGVRRILDAASGEAALERLGEAPPDLVILDHSMPGTTGLEVLRAMRQRGGRAAYVPVVMLTAFASPSLIAEARDHGVNEFLCKPVSLRAMSQHVRSALFTGRRFVDVPAYFGPDRRRRDQPIAGPDRRQQKAKARL
jgi:CheY-like chemotaxis protein